jgi:hypothetical protein
MSKKHITSPEEEALLGELIRSKFPESKTAYEAVSKAYKQMYPQGDLQGFSTNPADDALGEVTPTGERSFRVNVNERDLKAEKLPPGVNRNNWYTGLVAHEVLGHGGDIAENPYLWSGGPVTKERHFMKSPYAGVSEDSVGWLINDAKRKLKTEQEVESIRQQDIAQAKRLGLPYELPQTVKGQ